MPLLLLSCSARKAVVKKAPAGEMYTGALFTAGMKWAKENRYRVLILSAKYGWLTPETVIETYNTKRTTPYDGSWPAGEGFYLGGQLYFKNAPDRFQPLIPAATIGRMLHAMKVLNA